MGGDNTGQLIENIKTANPRGWSCLHIQEGSLKCSGVTIQNNQIGPCGVSTDGQWADGISLSCQNSLVQNNDIVDATDGGESFWYPLNTSYCYFWCTRLNDQK